MRTSNIRHVKDPAIDLTRSSQRDQRVSRVIQARRRLCPPRRGGRVWINGRELGGGEARFSHLSSSYD